MMILESDKVAFFDVDDTLIEWWPNTSGDPVDFVDLMYPSGATSRHKVLSKNVRSLIEHKKRGQKIVVWSAGGYEWAAEAVKKIGIEEYVDIVMSKPAWWYDDMTADEVLLKSLHRFNKET